MVIDHHVSNDRYGTINVIDPHLIPADLPFGVLSPIAGDAAFQYIRIASELDVRYLFWGALEQEAFPTSTQPWRTGASCIRQGHWGQIYDLKEPRINANGR